jgi:adenosylcobinamide-phosphate synthase
MSYAGAMLMAMIVDAAVGWPAWLFERIGHPVTWLGHLVAWLDRRFNRETHSSLRCRLLGVASSLAVIGIAVAAGAAIQSMLPEGWRGSVVAGFMAWPLVALRSLDTHVAAVAMPLAAGNLAAARAAVSMIVGRDPAMLDEAGVARSAIESLAENTSDGVVAPVLWGAVLGLPGIAAYKAINTLDSMIGHRTARHEDFGWAAARIDDVANLVPARLTALLFAAASSGHRRDALACALADAGKHRSPNAGWPEAAMAGAIGVRLSGPRVYHGCLANEPWLNAQGRDATAGDIGAGLGLYRRAMALLALLLAATAFVA